MAFAAALEQTAGGVEGDALADAGQHIGEVPVGRPRVADAAGGRQRQLEPSREVGERPVAVLLGTQPVALQLDVEPSREEMGQVRELAPGGVETAVDEPLSEDSLGAAGQAVEAVSVGLDLRPGRPSLALGPAARGLGQQPAEVAVAAAINGKQGQAGERRARR